MTDTGSSKPSTPRPGAPQPNTETSKTPSAGDSAGVRTSVGAILTQDLMFLSKVTGTAAALGLKVVLVLSPGELSQGLAEGRFCCVFLDLAMPGLPLHHFTCHRGPAKPKLIAFGPHVATAKLDEARAAGCDLVLPRSRFSSQLPEILRDVFGVTAT